MELKINSLAAALAIAAISLTGCDNKENETVSAENSETPANQTINPSIVENPMTAAEEGTKDQKLPEISFPEETYDFGKIKQGEMMKHQFKFKNTGNADLIITSASGSCGCTVPQWPKNPIPPGGEANIDVEFNSAGKSGMQRVNVTLIANTIPNTKVLTITGEVQAPN